VTDAHVAEAVTPALHRMGRHEAPSGHRRDRVQPRAAAPPQQRLHRHP
jgi:hypothetical protein